MPWLNLRCFIEQEKGPRRPRGARKINLAEASLKMVKSDHPPTARRRAADSVEEYVNAVPRFFARIGHNNKNDKKNVVNVGHVHVFF